MNKSVRLAFILSLVFLPFGLHAQDSGPSQKIPPGGTLRGDFTEDHYLSGSPTPVHSQGHFLIAPGRGILWVVVKPLPFTFAFTAKGMVQSIGGMPLLHVPAARLPLLGRVTDIIGNAMAGNWDALDRGFAVTHVAAGTGWRANIQPREAQSTMPFRALSAKGGTFVDSARVMRLDGGVDTFAFSHQSASAAPPTQAEMAALATANARNP